MFTRVSMDTGDTTTTSSFTLGYIGKLACPCLASLNTFPMPLVASFFLVVFVLIFSTFSFLIS